jgi:hypothetical protein
MPPSQAKPSRRGFIWGTAAAGAAAATVAALPKGQPQPLQAALAQPQAQPAPERGGGYHLSEHVQRYYKTTRL